MRDTSDLSSSIRILELNLADAMQEIVGGKNLPIEITSTTPQPGGLSAEIIDIIGQRAEIDKEELYAKNKLTLFAGGEQKIEYESTVAGRKVFIVLNFPTLDETKVSREAFQLVSATLTNNYVFLAQAAADAARRNGAIEVHLLMPNYAYARQDKTHKKRGPVSAAITAKNLEDYFDTITSVHLHSPAIEGMLRPGTLINISPSEIFAPSFVCRDPKTLQPISQKDITLDGVNELLSQLCIVSPDAGGTANARDFAKYCKQFAAMLLDVDQEKIVDIPLASIDKRRPGPNASEVMNVLGKENIVGRVAEIFDDMGDTFGTSTHAADALVNAGAKKVMFIGTHGYFSRDALSLIASSKIDQVIVTNSMALRPSVLQNPKTKVISIAPALVQVIADLTTEPEQNLRFHERYMGSNLFRNSLGRYVGAMMLN